MRFQAKQLSKVAICLLAAVVLLASFVGCKQPHSLEVENDVRSSAVWDLTLVYEHARTLARIPEVTPSYLYFNEVTQDQLLGKKFGHSLADFERQLNERPLRVRTRSWFVNKEWRTVGRHEIVFEASYRSGVRWFVLGITADGKLVRVSGNYLPTATELSDAVSLMRSIRTR
jgi:hypothetical protein